MRALRERHLSAATHAVLGRRLKTTVTSRVIKLPEWPLLGRSATDFVVDWPPGSRRPRHVGELKWCQQGDDKIYEAIWDLFELALAARIPTVRTAHLITGAPTDSWCGALCADIFDGGTFEPEELCTRRFPTGSKRAAWDWLLGGGYDRYPSHVPARIRTTPVTLPAEVAGPGGSWELRAVSVAPEPCHEDVSFPGGWPFGKRPSDARHPT